MKNLIIGLAIVAVLGGVWLARGDYINSTPESSPNQAAEGKNPIQKSESNPKNEKLEQWIEKLAKNENCPILGKVDSNGKLSYGDLCFQKDTFVRFVKEYNMLPNAEVNEYMNWIGDGKFQRQLAYKMLTDDYSNWTHWKNTVKNKIGFPPK